MRTSLLPLSLVLTLGACGSEAAAPVTAPPSPTPERPPATGSTAGTDETPAADEPAAPEAPPVDLLAAVPTALATSSAYRDAEEQVAALVDGDPETAWNSRTGDLEGAWIEVRLPADATVTGIAMIPGFAREGGRTDLFTGNHRVRRVRVLREGEEVATHALDVESRALQTIPVEGAGGVWRIELVELTPGSRTDWREACVSELQVLGRAPGAEADARFPRYAVGALPPAREVPAPDPTALARWFHDAMAGFTRAWREHDEEQQDTENNTGDPDVTEEEARRFRQTRRRELARVATLVEPVDAALSDRLRRRAHTGAHGAWRYRDHRDDLDLAARGFAAVAAHLSGDAPCRWATAHVGLRLARMANELRWQLEATEWGEMELEGDPAGQAEMAREGRALERLQRGFEPIAETWPNSRAANVARLRRLTVDLPSFADDWAAIQAELDTLDAC